MSVSFRTTCLAVFSGLFCATPDVCGQSLGGAGTVRVSVVDSSGSPVQSAEVSFANPITGFERRIQVDAAGKASIQGIPLNSYQLRITAGGFEADSRTVVVRNAVPLDLAIHLAIAGQRTSVTVEADPTGGLESSPVASQTVDRKLLANLPTASPDSGLNDAIIFTTPGVAADSNGFFHPLGDHAQVSYVIDGQPISDQRNKVFSTSLPANAIQSMDVISGSPPAEYGDKTSLVVNAITRSGLGQKTTGSFVASAGTFGSYGEEAAFGIGSAKLGNFLVLNSERTGSVANR